MRGRYRVLVIALISILILGSIVSTAVYIVRQNRISDFSSSLKSIDEYLGRGDRLRAESYIRSAISSARSEFQFIQLLKRSFRYAQNFDAPGIHFETAYAAVSGTAQQDQRFWAFVVDAALRNREYTTAMQWAFENLKHEGFQGLVLEAVLRGGGVQSSDGSEFGNFLLMLSRLLDDPEYDDFISAAEATNDSRYALNALLMALADGNQHLAYQTYLDYPDIHTHNAALIILLGTELGFLSLAESLLESNPPSPEDYYSLDLHKASAEIALRKGRFDSAAALYAEFIQDNRDSPWFYNNKLYAHYMQGDFFSSADTALDMIELFGDDDSIRLQFLRWYTQVHADLDPGPFDPDLALYKQRLEQHYYQLPVDDLFQLIHEKAANNARQYFSDIWLRFENDPANPALQRLAFFTALMFRDEAAMRAVIRRTTDTDTGNIFVMYKNIFNRNFLVPSDLEIFIASPVDILNAAIMHIHNGNYSEAAYYLDTAIKRVSSAVNETDTHMLLPTAWAYHAAVAILRGQEFLAREYIELSERYKQFHPITQQLEDRL
ncbi:hypothetical protein [Spirochaeta dissipatitropha]